MSPLQKTDPTARRKAITIVLVLLMLGYFILVLIEKNRFQLVGWLLKNADTISNHPEAIFAAITALFAPLLAFGIYLFRLGGKIVSAQRFPLQGYGVVRDTKIVKGRAAKRRGRFLQGLALILIVLVDVSILLVVNLIHEIASKN